eukprot:GHVS01055237.1.p1 GENE.GHVS01055237.1~~GHVS01055237.1.p1  ORF type:complete len:851 (+),score=154.82 GHVS01055237.1:219-2771(+)
MQHHHSLSYLPRRPSALPPSSPLPSSAPMPSSPLPSYMLPSMSNRFSSPSHGCSSTAGGGRGRSLNRKQKRVAPSPPHPEGLPTSSSSTPPPPVSLSTRPPYDQLHPPPVDGRARRRSTTTASSVSEHPPSCPPSPFLLPSMLISPSSPPRSFYSIDEHNTCQDHISNNSNSNNNSNRSPHAPPLSPFPSLRAPVALTSSLPVSSSRPCFMSTPDNTSFIQLGGTAAYAARGGAALPLPDFAAIDSPHTLPLSSCPSDQAAGQERSPLPNFAETPSFPPHPNVAVVHLNSTTITPSLDGLKYTHVFLKNGYEEKKPHVVTPTKAGLRTAASAFPNEQLYPVDPSTGFTCLSPMGGFGDDDFSPFTTSQVIDPTPPNRPIASPAPPVPHSHSSPPPFASPDTPAALPPPPYLYEPTDTTSPSSAARFRPTTPNFEKLKEQQSAIGPLTSSHELSVDDVVLSHRGGPLEGRLLPQQASSSHALSDASLAVLSGSPDCIVAPCPPLSFSGVGNLCAEERSSPCVDASTPPVSGGMPELKADGCAYFPRCPGDETTAEEPKDSNGQKLTSKCKQADGHSEAATPHWSKPTEDEKVFCAVENQPAHRGGLRIRRRSAAIGSSGRVRQILPRSGPRVAICERTTSHADVLTVGQQQLRKRCGMLCGWEVHGPIGTCHTLKDFLMMHDHVLCLTSPADMARWMLSSFFGPSALPTASPASPNVPQGGHSAALPRLLAMAAMAPHEARGEGGGWPVCQKSQEDSILVLRKYDEASCTTGGLLQGVSFGLVIHGQEGEEASGVLYEGVKRYVTFKLGRIGSSLFGMLPGARLCCASVQRLAAGVQQTYDWLAMEVVFGV